MISLAAIGGLALKIFGGPINTFIKEQQITKRDTGLATIQSDKEQGLATIAGAVEANKLRASSQPLFKPLIYGITLPFAYHAGAVCFDSVPFWTPWGAHVVGSWGVATLPGVYQTMQISVLTSFFVVAPVAQGIRAVGGIASAIITRR